MKERLLAEAEVSVHLWWALPCHCEAACSVSFAAVLAGVVRARIPGVGVGGFADDGDEVWTAGEVLSHPDLCGVVA